MSSKKLLPFKRSGASTEPFVEKLLHEINAMPGTSASYELVSKIIGIDVGSQRYRTIAMQWRKRLLRDRNIETKARDGQFQFLTADQAQEQRRNDFVGMRRRQGRIQAKLNAIDIQELSSEERKASHVVMQREWLHVRQVTRQAIKAIALPRPKRRGD